MITSVTKCISFDAAHYLLNSKWSREQNMATFHKCCLYKPDNNDMPHGHTYLLEVTVEGEIDSDTGFVIDFKHLKRILTEHVMEPLDHNLLNEVIPEFKRGEELATAENISYYIWRKIWGPIGEVCPGKIWLQQIKLYETPNSFALLTKEMVECQMQKVRWVHMTPEHLKHVTLFDKAEGKAKGEGTQRKCCKFCGR